MSYRLRSPCPACAVQCPKKSSIPNLSCQIKKTLLNQNHSIDQTQTSLLNSASARILRTELAMLKGLETDLPILPYGNLTQSMSSLMRATLRFSHRLKSSSLILTLSKRAKSFRQKLSHRERIKVCWPKKWTISLTLQSTRRRWPWQLVMRPWRPSVILIRSRRF